MFDGGNLKYILMLNNVVEIENQGALHAKVYKMICVPLETLKGQGVYIQKSFNTTIDKIVQEVYSKVQSTYQLETEPTKGERSFNIQSEPAFHVIEMLRKEAISEKYPTSNFMFYQTAKGFNFKCMDYLANQDVVKTYKQTNLVGYTFNNPLVDINILTWRINQMHDAMSRIKTGVVNQTVSTFNVYTNDFNVKTFSKIPGTTEMGAFVPTTMPTFWQLFEDCFRNVLRVINPAEELKIGPSYIPDNLQNKMVNLAQWLEQQLIATVIGDPVLKAGVVIKCDVPQVIATETSKLDIQVSGKWLCSKIHHDIRRPDVRPRWITRIEAIKGAFAE